LETEFIPCGRRRQAGLLEDVLVDEQTQRLRRKRQGINLSVGAVGARKQCVCGHIGKRRHVGAVLLDEIACLHKLFEPPIGVGVDDVTTLAAGERSRHDCRIALIREGFELHVNIRIFLGKVGEQLVVSRLVFLSPGPE
jgi:hypothetical protein